MTVQLQASDCTLKESLIISSVIRESKLPPKHAGAAIDIIAGLPYTGANAIMLRTLLDKKYALAYSVVDTVYNHFIK